jgi:hypothetical protein
MNVNMIVANPDDKVKDLTWVCRSHPGLRAAHILLEPWMQRESDAGGAAGGTVAGLNGRAG